MSVVSPSDLPDVRGAVAFDVETSGLHPDDGARISCVSVSWRCELDGVRSVGFPFDQGIRDKLPSYQMSFDEEDPNLGEEEWLVLLAWLANRDLLVAHNSKFDLMFVTAGTRHWAGLDLVKGGVPVFDTMLAEKELAPRLALGLDATAKRYGLDGKSGIEQLQAWLKRQGFKSGRYDLAPWWLMEGYVIGDTEITLEVYEEQIGRLAEKPALAEKLAREHRLRDVLYLVEQRGILYDSAKSLEAARMLEEKATEIESRLPFSGPTQAKRYFFDKVGIVPMRTSDKTGEPALDEEQLRRMTKQGVEWAAEYAWTSRARRAVSMWYRGYPDKVGPDGRLRCSYKQAFVKSGRMSVERVQLQAVPKYDKSFEGIPHVRDCILPGEDMELWNLDLSQAELRVAAKYAQCEGMLRLLGQGADLHGITCQGVLGAKPEDDDWKVKRDIAKRLTFGGIFQIGPDTFQETLGKLGNIYLPLSQCKDLVYGWRGMYPEFTTAYYRAQETAKTKGRVKVLPGSAYESLSWLGERDYPNTGWSRIVQGSLAEFLKLWLIEAEEGWPGVLVLTVHDSLVLETRAGEGEGVATEIAALGTRMFGEVFGIEGKVDFGKWRTD